jgi:hypothetical protein
MAILMARLTTFSLTTPLSVFFCLISLSCQKSPEVDRSEKSEAKSIDPKARSEVVTPEDSDLLDKQWFANIENGTAFDKAAVAIREYKKIIFPDTIWVRYDE